MISVFFTAIACFMATNIDDILVLTVLYAASNNVKDRFNILMGQCVGLLITVVIAIAGAYVLNALDSEFTYLLGIIPITMGIKEFFISEKENKEIENSLSIVSVTMIALADGGDNIGIYIPLFAGYDAVKTIVTVAIFLILMIGTCHIAKRIGEFKPIEQFVQKYRKYVISGILTVLGIIIILKGILG